MTLMVALVGGQPLPNLLPARHYRPDDLLLVYTSTTKGVYERLMATLKEETTIHELKTDAYDIVTIVEDLNNKLDLPELAKQSTVFNLTGGTKAMVLAAYQVAQLHSSPILYLESEGKYSRVYHYVWQNQQLKAVSNEILPECVKLEDLLNVYLGPGLWQELGPDRSEGSSFEVALAETLRSYGYEVMIGISALGGQVEIDVAMRFGNQFGIIEAKMGDNGKKLDGIKQLSNAVRHLGTYTQTFYTITVPPSRSHTAITDASRIQVISLPEYVRGADRLSPNEEATFIASVDKAMKG